MGSGRLALRTKIKLVANQSYWNKSDSLLPDGYLAHMVRDSSGQ